jgi:DNA-binding response OmpR family regulator
MTDILEASNRVPKVLIADDDPGIVRFLANRCAKMGFEVQTPANGLQAMSATAASNW